MNIFFRWLSFFLFILIIAVGIFAAGYFTNKHLANNKNASQSNNSNTANTKVDPFFASHIATIQGKITSVSDDILTIQNNQGVSGELKLSKDYQIYNSLPGSRGMSTPSADLKLIELNKEVSISTTSVDDEFQITTIHF